MGTGVIYSIIRKQQRRALMSEEEYARRATGSSSLSGSAMLGFDHILRPEAKAAMEYQQEGEAVDAER